MTPYLSSISLLAASSCVMVTAWYAHLKFKHLSLPTAILFSWFLALIEYSLMIPANRIGHSVMSAAQLRVLAELFTLVAFAVFSVKFLDEQLTWNSVIAFALILIAVALAFYGPFTKVVSF